MRYLFGFICVLALGVMGCGETSGTDCTGEEDLTPCERSGEFPAQCIGEVCLAQGCGSGDDNAILCMYENPSTDDIEPGVCSDGSCVIPVEDCAGEDNFTDCRSDGMVGHCYAGVCATIGCSGPEDGTYCVNPVFGDGFLGVCEAGECTKPEHCTGIADGVSCTGGDGGFCEGGECVTPP